ncbi:MAG: ATP-binding cassette domain-containing protein [Actinobacteria bacterium]|nr:MAG: ATP-binding cassette domain-containing protein [Actinomycetota bacterium]
MRSAVELRDVFRIYPAPEGASVALQGLTLSIAEREIVLVLGPSGSGKSTLLRIVAGLDRPSAGVARVLESEPAKLRHRRLAAFRSQHLGILDQHYARSLSPDLTCRETVGLRLALLGLPRPVCDREAIKLLERVGLRDRAGERPGSLSGGEQQRVAVCAALVHRPRLLLADEPGGELDASNAAAIYELIAELVRERGATALVVSHDPDATAIADRLLTIRDGRLGEERERNGPGRLVVGRGGWLRLPEALIREAGIGSHVSAHASERRLVLEAAGGTGEQQRERPPLAATTVGGEPVATLSGVEKRFRQRSIDRVVFEDLNAAFLPGLLTLVTGRSGSGKTTLLGLLAGLGRPTRGTVRVLGREIQALSRPELSRLRRTHIGLVDQEPGLVPFLSALENVVLALSLRRGTGAVDLESTARATLVELRVGERAEQRVDRLSAGERQRVALARALAHGPRLLLADEPTARLDIENARVTAGLLLRAAKASGAAVVCATHDPVLLELADDIVRLD